jgi:hypothetical protein
MKGRLLALGRPIRSSPQGKTATLPQRRSVNDDFGKSDLGKSEFSKSDLDKSGFSNNGLGHVGVDVSWFPAW